MKIKNKKILSIIVVFALAITGVSANTAEIYKTEKELDRVSDLLKEVDADREKNEATQKTVSNDIRVIELEINEVEKDIDNINTSITNTENDIVDKEAELVTAEKNIDLKKEILNKRLRVMYKTGSIGYLEVLLGSDDFEDLLTRVDAVKKIFIHDTNLIELLIQQRNIVENAKLELVKFKQSLESLFVEKKEAQKVLKTKSANLSVYKKKLVADHAVFEKQLDKLNADAKKIKNIIKNLKLSEKYVGGIMTWPAPGNMTITSKFGNRMHPILRKMKLHTGIDIAVPSNSSIVAAQSGTIIHSDWLGGYGKVIMIDHGGGIVTLYAHNNKLLLNVGDKVTKGQVIAKSGSTGQSTGPHLHFEVRVNGDYVDPMKYVTKQ